MIAYCLVKNKDIKIFEGEGKFHACVGCGYCCRQAPCGAAVRVYGSKGEGACPGLKWDVEKKRYWCALCQAPHRLGESYREELSVGAGCCSPLFNEDRKNIPPPQKNEMEEMTYTLPKEVQVLVSALAQEWVTSDLLFLTFKRATHMLGGDDRFFVACMQIAQQQRASHIERFMG